MNSQPAIKSPAARLVSSCVPNSKVRAHWEKATERVEVTIVNSHHAALSCSLRACSFQRIFFEKRSTMPEHTLKKSTMPQGFFHASFSKEFLGSEYCVKKECEILGVEE